ncbi:hypothetical protein P691DRAFT_16423 [Macrolepiota fuliginosa MF-IS2]|uniref:Uncharacterized protein n=1 Tax=Macrolepiota fuliginosa MF-IS2 TaxID=1400762 RepID=A0A9P5XQJ6_9AGAR|nr:hypothetical protein P691DRAFT_16423 [Macrolepiota fuliginosa MF-IS2]
MAAVTTSTSSIANSTRLIIGSDPLEGIGRVAISVEVKDREGRRGDVKPEGQRKIWQYSVGSSRWLPCLDSWTPPAVDLPRTLVYLSSVSNHPNCQFNLHDKLRIHLCGCPFRSLSNNTCRAPSPASRQRSCPSFRPFRSSLLHGIPRQIGSTGLVMVFLQVIISGCLGCFSFAYSRRHSQQPTLRSFGCGASLAMSPAGGNDTYAHWRARLEGEGELVHIAPQHKKLQHRFTKCGTCRAFKFRDTSMQGCQ